MYFREVLSLNKKASLHLKKCIASCSVPQYLLEAVYLQETAKISIKRPTGDRSNFGDYFHHSKQGNLSKISLKIAKNASKTEHVVLFGFGLF